MLIYLIIGFIVQTIVIIERAIRIPEYWSLLDWGEWDTWLGLVLGIVYNVLLWPVTIVAEIINIKHQM